MPKPKKQPKKVSVFKQVGAEHAQYLRFRREVIQKSNDALNRSKKAIFALHRNDPKSAADGLKEAVKSFKACEELAKTMPRLKHEGSYQAALEEYAEASLFAQFIKTGEFGKLDRRAMYHTTYLAALSDATGELVRYAMREATAGRYENVQKAKATTEKTIEFLLGLDLTGYLRQKFDQAKKNLRNLEQIMYEITLRK